MKKFFATKNGIKKSATRTCIRHLNLCSHTYHYPSSIWEAYISRFYLYLMIPQTPEGSIVTLLSAIQ